MTEDFNLEAFRYLLDELDPTARAEFESLLERDPAVRAALKQCTAAVAQFARDTAPAEVLPPAQHRATLAAVMATAVAESKIQGAPSWNWKRFIWPMAAGLLLMLNLVQYFQSRPRDSANADSAGNMGSVELQLNGNDPDSKKTKKHGPTSGLAKPDADGLEATSIANADITAELRRLEKLRADYATLRRAREALNAEYSGVIRQLAQRALVPKGVDHLAAMELVDPGAYVRGERKGLVDIARGLITAPGIVTVEPVTLPPTPDPSVNPRVPMPDPTASTVANPNASTPQAQPNPSPAPPPETPQTSTGTPGDPYAWSVYDEASSRGYLNLYNLPVPSANESLQLWVKGAGSTTYQRVGEVPPQFYGGSGSLYYNLPAATESPSDILITREPRNAPPSQPTGPTVLHGP